ncbi:hypothetical protein GO003_012340 [Methylicorpusculum oleiharenae]|uniref:hypothetical protein n=1 Tax=Methylicorpusculum oleiharenae TaxID=1338687 RepID=UPI0013DD8964|nr:hypothetical protein [Methylicorpusculum oleiharenae]MCD2451181.1 hypothetical protein [Methylicorpusculum oleiharenae]
MCNAHVLTGPCLNREQSVPFALLTELETYLTKTKAGVPVELGLRAAVVEDQHRFILHHHIMEKATDDQIAVPLVEQTQACFLRYPHD